jgi:pimeloyl-ACP methyl ester carboxylesterase
MEKPILLESDRGAALEGDLVVPERAAAIVVFAHGSGSSRHSPRNRYVASVLQKGGFGTLLMDLLTEEEERIDMRTRHLRFDIGLLADRLENAVDSLQHDPSAGRLPIGYFGASTGAAAAIVAASRQAESIGAVVSRGGRPDLAAAALRELRAPTLLIVGGEDDVVLELNRRAMAEMRCSKELAIVAGATHLFEEPGTLEQAADLALGWFRQWLGVAASRDSAA